MRQSDYRNREEARPHQNKKKQNDEKFGTLHKFRVVYLLFGWSCQ